MAGPLTVLGETLQGLVDESHVLLVDVEAEEAQAARGASADAVQELQGLAHQIVVGLVVLAAEEVLQWGRLGGRRQREEGKVTHPPLRQSPTGWSPGWVSRYAERLSSRRTEGSAPRAVSRGRGPRQWPSTLRPVPRGDGVWDAVEEGWPLTAHGGLLQPFQPRSLPHSSPPGLSPGVRLTGTWHVQDR